MVMLSLPRIASSFAVTVIVPLYSFKSFLQTKPSSVLPLMVKLPEPFSFISSRENTAPLTVLVTPSLSTYVSVWLVPSEIVFTVPLELFSTTSSPIAST